MPAIRLLAPAFSILALAAAVPPVAAQFGGATILPADSFRLPPAPPKVTGPEQVTVTQAPEPTFEENSFRHTHHVLAIYRDIAARGGWPALPPLPAGARLGPGTQSPVVAVLRQRLVVTGDLAPQHGSGDAFDPNVEAGVRRFQVRHGLTTTGAVGPMTLKALNVPAAQRVRQLEASLARLSQPDFVFGQRYVAVNIPAAAVEAVENGNVTRRFVAVVGRPDRATPEVTTRITAVNLNPTWTAPLSIVKKDIVPKVRKDPSFLAKMNMRLIDSSGRDLDPAQVDWSGASPVNFTVRQAPGTSNALGVVRIDMPNNSAVYMHDTPKKELFSSDYRFHSSGCVRVGDVRAFAAWLLEDTAGWNRPAIEAEIASGRRTDIRLERSVPVIWIYMTGWGTRDGLAHFRDDVYDLDDERRLDPAVLMAQTRPAPVRAGSSGGFMLQSASKQELVFKDSENRLDDR